MLDTKSNICGGFLMSKFTAEERIKIVLRNLNGHESISEIAQEVQVTPPYNTKYRSETGQW